MLLFLMSTERKLSRKREVKTVYEFKGTFQVQNKLGFINSIFDQYILINYTIIKTFNVSHVSMYSVCITADKT